MCGYKQAIYKYDQAMRLTLNTAPDLFAIWLIWGCVALCWSLSSAYASEPTNPPSEFGPSSELHIGRLIFQHSSSYTWGPGRPWWRIDWPEAEQHFIGGVQRYTSIDVATDSAHISLLDDSVFDYPWLLAQQVGRWRLSDAEVATLSEYLLRGGFMIVDDFHGPQQWSNFLNVIKRALPTHQVVDLPLNATLLQIHYEMKQVVQIPGRRHIAGFDSNQNAIVRMPHTPSQWKGIYDDNDRLMIAINFNMDMGDAWEHADDPGYPNVMTSLAYRLGINYVIYAMTH